MYNMYSSVHVHWIELTCNWSTADVVHNTDQLVRVWQVPFLETNSELRIITVLSEEDTTNIIQE